MNDGHGGIEAAASGPNPAGLELRVTRLEDQSSRIEALMKSIEERLRRLELDVAGVKGRVYSLPGTWAMITTMIGGQIAFLGLVFAVVVRLVAK